MTTKTYLDLFSDDIIETIFEQFVVNVENSIEKLINKVKKYGLIRWQLLKTNSTFDINIRFQLAFIDLPDIREL